MIGKVFVAGAIILAFSQYSLADSFDEIIKGLDKPYAVTTHSQTGVRCVWTKSDSGYLNSENFGNEGTGLCWSKESLEQAESMDRRGDLKWNPGKFSAYQFFTDLHNACFYGYMGRVTRDWEKYLVQKYAKTSSKYSGDATHLDKLGKAFDYGKLVSKSPNDCMDISKSLFSE